MAISKAPKACACTQGLRDLLRATTPKNDPLRKVTCAACGTIFWTNAENDYCFDCEAKKTQS